MPNINDILTASAIKLRQYFKQAQAAQQDLNNQGLTDAKGRLCPISIISQVDLAREALIKERMAEAQDLARRIARFRAQTEADIDEFIRVSNSEHAAKIGGRGKTWKGNLQLVNYNATLKINIKIADRIAFNEKINLAMQKIQSLIDENSSGINDIIKTLVQEAFSIDQTGAIDAKKVMALRKHNIQHPIWQAAMQDIADSIQIVGSKSYLQFWWRDTPEGEWQAVPLDIARV